MRTLVIPDVHIKPEHVDLTHIEALAHFIRVRKPENVVFIGDFWDMPALFSTKRAGREMSREWAADAEGRRFFSDIEAGKRAFNIIIDAIRKTKGYSPEIHFCEGNHEYELKKFFKAFPFLNNPVRKPHETVLSATNIEDFIRGRKITFHPFLSNFDIDGIVFSYCYLNEKGNAIQISTAHSNLFRYSHVWGHSPKWGYKQEADRFGGKIFWLCTGSFLRDSKNWSGVSILHHNGFGDADVEQVSIERIMSDFN